MANWIAVASADHVRIGQRDGIMQVCHGKAGPLRKTKPGDRVVYYSPSQQFRGPATLQSFTAIGVVQDGAPYQFDMGGGFVPYRRDIMWLPSRDAPIRPLLEQLDFTAGRTHWGAPFRFGIFSITDRDMKIIAAAMDGHFPPPEQSTLGLCY